MHKLALCDLIPGFTAPPLIFKLVTPESKVTLIMIMQEVLEIFHVGVFPMDTFHLIIETLILTSQFVFCPPLLNSRLVFISQQTKQQSVMTWQFCLDLYKNGFHIKTQGGQELENLRTTPHCLFKRASLLGAKFKSFVHSAFLNFLQLNYFSMR